ncbi:PH domain-containing protein [Streptomyces albus subsp. chlorinus]|uniref:PH domain-containing protein n=1 Tax=Streptomyces albus TaxID=1888 RepID=UPI001570C942|nr:PH domain-containing protein [Streptomyces albus]NSC25379.1 PH domain-containing protein [Streptomyces albus subsp. chlorinus]
MTAVQEVTCRFPWKRPLWFLVGLGAAGAVLAAVRLAGRGGFLDAWLGVGVLLALVGVPALYALTVRVSADADGVHSRTLLRRRTVRWDDIAGLRIHLVHERNPRVQDARRLGLALRDGRRSLLPLPRSWTRDDPDFEAHVDAFRALHARHGAPESDHVPVISYRTAGYGSAGLLTVCVLLLAGAGVAAWCVPDAAAYERAWRSATPCAAGTPAMERRECLTTTAAVVARTEANQPRRRSWLYFTDDRPLERLAVPREAAQGFRSGDRVELTIWRGEVRKVAGRHYVWRKHIVSTGSVALLAAALALAAGYPGARMLVRLRGRRLPDDEVLPPALPFAGALAGTAVWLLPLCYLHPTIPLSTPATVAWTVAGSLVTLGLLCGAWRATRVRTPAAAADEHGRDREGAYRADKVYVPARFLEPTDYNPHLFGTHILLGDGPPAVTPHPGPGRFAAKPVPVERLTLKTVRRVRGDDGDTVPRSWHIAELDDAGRTVRLAAAPADLARVLRELGGPSTPAHPARTTPPASSTVPEP